MPAKTSANSSDISSGWDAVSDEAQSQESMCSNGDSAFWKDQTDIVISGVSGRFPRCDNVQEFGDLLMNKEDLVTEDDLRWPPGMLDLPKRHGKLKELKKFDAQFFSVTPKQANFMDPQVRILLEVTWEALVDAGLNPNEMRGSRTGVFVGCSASETSSALTSDPETVTGYTLMGCVRSMFSNRLSYSFDFRGPSFSVDTACSSSLLALQLAIDAIRQGQCDSAVVAGAHLTLTPTAALQFLRLGMLSEKGSCRSFDESGDGYCRTEGIAAIYLQRKDKAKRVYATVVHAKSNTDGNKEQGITFPSGERQAALLEEVYAEAGVDPNTVYYVETHGTGTKVGDPQEANAICSIFCSNRPENQPLLIGSVKSNMGHAEPASGVCSLAKVLLAIEREMIPPNLHYNTPNPYIQGLSDGRLQVVTEPTPLPGGYIGVNSFGFGGSNTHALLKAADHKTKETAKPLFTKLILYSGRTPEAVANVFNKVEEHKDDSYFHALLSNQANLPPKDTPYRGYLLLNRENDAPALRDIQKIAITEPRPIYYIYSGMGSQWPGMAQKLMAIPAINESLIASSKTLDEFGQDVYGMLCNSDPAQYLNNPLNCILAITAIQIAITDVLDMLGIVPDGIIGHSTGEMGCGYADGAITREQTMRLAYHRGRTITAKKHLIQGAMAAVGLTWEEVSQQVPEGVVPACHNGADSVTISGDAEKIKVFCENLQEKGIFAKIVDSSGIPFHSPAMLSVQQDMLDAMKTAVPEPQPRSSRWISTSIPEDQWDSELASTCSAEYHVHNACSPVLFYDALMKIPPGAVTIEIAPHALMQAVLRRSLQKTVINVGMMNMKADNELENFIQSIGKIYQTGVSVNLEKLYPPVEYPVPKGTPMIGSLWKWDHTQDWPVIDGKALSNGFCGGVAASASYTIDPFAADSKEAFLLDHVIDGRVLYPFTGHMVLAWRTLCKIKGVDYQKTPVIFENINVYSATILTNKPIRLDVVITPGSNQFDILYEEQVAASGKIYIPEENQPFYYSKLSDIRTSKIADRIELDNEDAYKEFLLRGYEYGQAFRGIYRTCNSGERGTLYWTGNWVTFLDSLLQTALLAERADTLRLPTRVRYLRIDPNKHAQCVTEKDGIQVVELRNDIATNGCVAGGVECCDLTAHTVARRVIGNGQLYFEKIYFVPHFDTEALKEFPADRKSFADYTMVLKTVIANGFTAWEKAGLLAKLPNGEHLQKILKELKPFVGKEVPADLKIRFTDDSKGPILHAFEEVFKYDPSSEDVVQRITKYILPLCPVFDTDRFRVSALIHERFIKTIQDIATENSAGHNNHFCGVELRSTEQLKHCIEALASHPLLEFEWAVVGPSVEHFDDLTLEQFGARKMKLMLDDPNFSGHNDAKNFDYVLFDQILSTKKDPVEYLVRLKSILRDDGFIVVIEPTKEYALMAAIQSFLGTELVVDESRIHGRYFTHEELMDVFKKAGYNICNYQSDASVATTTYLIRKLPAEPRDPVFVDVDDIVEFSWIEPLKEIVEARLNEPDTKTIWLTNTKVRTNGVLGMALCFREENLKSNRFRTLIDMSLDPKTRDGPPVLHLEDDNVKEIIELDLHSNDYRDGAFGSLRHVIVKDEDLHQHKEVEHAFINTLLRGDVSSLTWIESPNQFFEASEKRPNTQMCYVYYAAVNFRDVMLAYGRLPPDAIPGNFADRECLLGMEFAGRLKDGSRWMGILPAQALATSVVIDKEYAWEVPESWSLADAATVPVVYATAYYALICRGRLRQGDTCLIHGGSGGVGQAAIAIALAHGCEVYTTVGTEEKRQYLKKKFPALQDKHFANSRSADFELHIRHETKGRGVDIVLNSLAQEMLQASLRCLAQHGRFLEIGKVDLSQNSALGMALFLKNVTFHGILLDAIMDQSVGNKADWKEVADLLNKGIKSGIVEPLNYTAFSAQKAEEAFRFMSSGKHIGKVLMEIRQEESERIVVPRPIKVKAVCRSLCHPKHVYLVSGGLGGFGLELTQWLINRGARKVVLTSRTGIRTGYQARCVHFWRRLGISVLVSTQNISREADAFELIRQCLEMGPIGGVFHLAMVLRDCLFENQNVQNFKDAAEAKYFGTKNLDNATRQLCDKEALKWFVVFSSITSGRGNAGQTNYGWSNSTMERMIEIRRQDGYPGIAVQWGAIGDVGVILENMGDNNTVVGGTLPQRMPSCLSALDNFLSWNHPIVSSYIKADVGQKKAAGGGNLLQTIAHILGVNDISQLNPDANLGDLGLDSLMGVEIKQALERDYDIVLSMKDIRTLTLNKLQMLAESGGSAGPSLQISELDMKKEGEREAEQNTVAELERQMNQLFKMRVDVNDLDPQNVIVKCNKVEEGPIVFFVHSIEGIATPLQRVMKRCEFPSYCLQSTKEVPQDSIENVAKHFIKAIKTVQPEGPYRIIGYSYGACIGFEMACQLQKLEGPDAVERLILLDGSHLYMQAYRNVYRMAFGVTGDTLVNNPLFESEIMCAMTLRFANVDYKKFRVELLQMAGFKARVNKVVDTVMLTGLFKSPDTVAFACEAMRSKFLMADKYKPECKFDGQITLIRAEQGAAREEDVGKDYGISQVSTDQQVFVVEGDHDTFVQGKSSAKTVQIINSLILNTPLNS